MQALPENASQEEIQETNAKANENSRKAIPYLEMVHQIDPRDAQIVNTLLNLSIRLDDVDRFEKYKAIQKKLSQY